MKKINKKGAEFSIGMLIALVLGLVILVVVALGFTMGWNNLFSKFKVWSGGSTLTTVGQACQIACTAGDSTAFCKETRDIAQLTENQLTSTEVTFDKTAGSEKLTIKNNNKEFKVEKDGDNWKLKSITCDQLVEAKMISIGDCTRPSCA